MKSTAVATLALVGAASAFHSVTMTVPKSAQVAQDFSRRGFLSTVAAAGAAAVAPALAIAADGTPAVEKVPLGPMPVDWGLTKDYYTDASKVVSHMRYATSMEKGAANIENVAKNCRQEMIDFVSYYRRFPNVSGKLSYSNLYTSINVLAGHYASYGPKFPVPEKRRKRLMEEYSQIDKAIKRQR
ncbi:photosystem II Pbs27-domain-containing protein [Tribonema minus]|uniref:Photosystem II Pbs27-domain-containing protein n=1 Tax=Tribonema minus TaxID=303371 RepID=A0A836C8X1_9STRA|nr:photosystem II Pbs27-domain-containing protein [Tribonema minus]